MKTFLLFSLVYFLSYFSYAQWSIHLSENNPISVAGSSLAPQIISDGAGGAIITWCDIRNGTNYDAYVQKISRAGIVEWTVNGVPICAAPGNQQNTELSSDGLGGAIIVWEDYRSGTDGHIYAQRISSAGVVKWTVNGVSICAASNSQYSPQITSDGSGGAIITWQDSRNGTDFDIYAQKINSAGVVQWTTNGVPISTLSNNQVIPQIVSDGTGGAIITWQDHRNGTDGNIYAQMVNASGLVQWTVNGVTICTGAGNHIIPLLISDGSGGAIIAWQDSRNANYDIYAQRVSSAGVVQWTANGNPVCNVSGDQYYQELISDGKGGAIITWQDLRNFNADIYAQRINTLGLLQWTNDGVPICTATYDQYLPQIASDGAGGAIITWYDYRSGNGANIYAQKINSFGTVQWLTDGILVSRASNTRYLPVVVSDGSGGAIITWKDDRGFDYNIYAQRIDGLGYLGIANPSLASVKDIKADQGGEVSVNWNASAYDKSQENVITYYSVWRGINSNGFLSKETSFPQVNIDFSGSAFRTLSTSTGTTYWEWLGNIPAHYLNNYSFTAKTLLDSTSSGNPYSKFLVSAQTSDPFIFWDSNVDSGYSVDNLSPLSPQNFAAAIQLNGNVKLTWDKNYVDPDLKNYEIYRSPNEGFTPEASTLLSKVTDTIYVDMNVPGNSNNVYYKAEAVDIHGNKSTPSQEAQVILTGIDEKNNEPLKFEISQNYPNPFNPTTTINFSIAQPEYVIIKIFDVLGREVQTLVDRQMSKGIYKVNFNGSSLSSGIYYYRIHAGDFVQTKEAILLK